MHAVMLLKFSPFQFVETESDKMSLRTYIFWFCQRHKAGPLQKYVIYSPKRIQEYEIITYLEKIELQNFLNDTILPNNDLRSEYVEI